MKPSPAMVVACVALIVALSGGAYAAATINGASIKPGTVTPTKIKKRSLTGSQIRANGIGGPSIKESTLGEVPKAKTAQTATNATNSTNATQLAGVAASSYQQYGAVLPARATVSGVFSCDVEFATSCRTAVSLPAPAPSSLVDATVNFAASVGSFVAGDADATCTGTANNPTAPPGKACLYFANNLAPGTTSGVGNAIANTNSTRGFEVLFTQAVAIDGIDIEGVWAYTAP